MRKLFLFALVIVSGFPIFSQETATDKEVAYTKTITTRAEKIVAALDLHDSLKKKSVTSIITCQYRNLNKVYTERDSRIQKIKQENEDKYIADSLVRILEEQYWNNARKLHEPFIAALSKELNKDQVILVKDGMTYNVLPVTYKAMLEMIPTLKPAEKEQIMTWLVEAREYAMDAESSEKKHWWFGKYKGKINNYLAAQGYDLQKERKDWEHRMKTSKDQKTVSQQ